MRLQTAIESLAKIDEGIRHRYFGDEWREIKGMRNLLAHRYEVLDLMELESVLTEDLQLLIANISSIIRDDPPS